MFECAKRFPFLFALLCYFRVEYPSTKVRCVWNVHVQCANYRNQRIKKTNQTANPDEYHLHTDFIEIANAVNELFYDK